MGGAFAHTLREWSEFTAAIFMVVLDMNHYRITDDATTPGIGVTLFAAGCIGAFHTIAADRLIRPVTDNTNSVPLMGLSVGCICMDKRERFTDKNLEPAQQNRMSLNKKLATSNKQLKQLAEATSHDLQQPLRIVTSPTASGTA